MDLRLYEPALFAALVDAMHALDHHYFGERAAARAEVERSVATGLLGSDSGVRLAVAVDGHRIAGLATFALLYPAPEQRAQLFMKDLYVCQAWRGRRVGEELMRFLARYAVSKACIRFDWTTEESNDGAIAFYERLGARRVKEKVYYRLTGDEIAGLADGAGGSSAMKPGVARQVVPPGAPRLDDLAAKRGGP